MKLDGERRGGADPKGRISDRREEHRFAPKAQISFSFAFGKRCCLTANDVMLRINDVATNVANETFAPAVRYCNFA